MPVYLCKPGWSHPEPWRHGVQVYSRPFPIDEEDARRRPPNDAAPPPLRARYAVRRVRHAEVVLVDEVSVRHGRSWLRLRWPGPRGGSAGYVALGDDHRRRPRERGDDHRRRRPPPTGEDDRPDERGGHRLEPIDDDDDDEPLNVDDFDDPPGPASPPLLRCESTGLYYPSSETMELLHDYDDGLSDHRSGSVARDGGSSVAGRVISSTSSGMGHGFIRSLAAGYDDDSGDPVFCRICREGLHDVEFESGAAARPDDPVVVAPPPLPENDDDDDNGVARARAELLRRVASTHPTVENPLLAPCECAGSMGFVHYLCVEQWRCRSRHPAARDGAACETCGAVYALPPPPARPEAENDDRLVDGAPFRVLAALRRPHLGWRVGAALARRRWARPLVPVVASPVVAAYCRARRTLKKRGVSRRRWACSLCRRRARWKCVRCLRSYYCSRQCQNVSWHIVHKHVCYKPARLGWSVLFYGVLVAVLVPGVWRSPLVHLSGLALVPLNFYQIGVLAGGMASLAKKILRVDARGRCLEVTVVLLTVLASVLSWGLVRGFFGVPEACVGLPSVVGADWSSWTTRASRTLLFDPARRVLDVVDALSVSLPRRATEYLCDGVAGGCFETTRNADPNFAARSPACADDLAVLAPVHLAALCVTAFGSLRGRRRDRRGGGGGGRNAEAVAGAEGALDGGRAGGGGGRPHED